MFFTSKKIIGLDIGTSSIKCAELSLSRNTARLENFYIAPSPVASISGGDILNKAAITEALAVMLEQLSSKKNSVATSIWGTGVVVKKISVPVMDTKLLTEQIKFEAEQYIPFDLNDVNIDFHVLKNTSKSDSMDVLLVAARKTLIINYTESIEMAGLDCSIIDLSGFALANCFQFNYGNRPGEVIGILNFGASCTNFVVIDNDQLVFSRDIPVGGSNFTVDIQNQLGLSLEEAESLKISYAFGKEIPKEAMDVIKSSAEAIVEEVSRSIEFYGASSAGNEIQKYYITGGSIGLGALQEELKLKLQRPIENMNAFSKITYNTKKLSPDFITQIANFVAISFGLGLRKQGDV